ncbi:MAG: DUF1416 domain-containing protein [Nocardioidaceae bacterium]
MSCGGATSRTAYVDLATQAVIQGTVVRAGRPVQGAYVRLLDRGGEFTAEVPTGAAGEFRFFAAAGVWTVRVLAAGSPAVEATVSAATGAVAEVELTL